MAVANNKRRHLVQNLLWPVVVMVIALGWKYPLLGFSVPLVMLAGLIGGFFKGRWVCGHVCPRGGLFDRVIARFSPSRPISPILRNVKFRWAVFAALMGFMALQISRNPTSLEHLGHVFWLMCAVTTALGLALAFVYHPRTWCAFCPMGTMQYALSPKGLGPLLDKSACRACGKCEKACPLQLKILERPGADEPDCLSCGECVAACPVRALSFK